MQCEETVLALCKTYGGAELLVYKQRSPHSPMTILTMMKWTLMALVLFTSVASAQSVQTIDSEAQLASVLCRNPKEDTSNKLLLDKNTQLVNATLWNALLDCASSAQRQGSATKSVEIY